MVLTVLTSFIGLLCPYTPSLRPSVTWKLSGVTVPRVYGEDVETKSMDRSRNW